jgi:hypothetical protein
VAFRPGTFVRTPSELVIVRTGTECGVRSRWVIVDKSRVVINWSRKHRIAVIELNRLAVFGLEIDTALESKWYYGSNRQRRVIAIIDVDRELAVIS